VRRLRPRDDMAQGMGKKLGSGEILLGCLQEKLKMS
jgi:hypothetical protein